MPVLIGEQDVKAAYIGNQIVNAAYVGNQKVYPNKKANWSYTVSYTGDAYGTNRLDIWTDWDIADFDSSKTFLFSPVGEWFRADTSGAIRLGVGHYQYDILPVGSSGIFSRDVTIKSESYKPEPEFIRQQFYPLKKPAFIDDLKKTLLLCNGINNDVRDQLHNNAAATGDTYFTLDCKGGICYTARKYVTKIYWVNELENDSFMTTIGNYFARNCYNLVRMNAIPGSVCSIGTYFMHRCYTFNDALDLSACQLGANFPSTHTVGEAFMYECDDFMNSVILARADQGDPGLMWSHSDLTLSCIYYKPPIKIIGKGLTSMMFCDKFPDLETDTLIRTLEAVSVNELKKPVINRALFKPQELPATNFAEVA